jgi:tetratricopeptide (TPR) repeat protein
MGEISARAPYFVGAILALIATFVYYDALNGQRGVIATALDRMDRVPGVFGPYLFLLSQVLRGLISSAAPITFIIVVFVPACLLAARFIERRDTFASMLRQDYAPIVSCALYAWTAAHLIMLIPVFLVFNSADQAAPSPDRIFVALAQTAPLGRGPRGDESAALVGGLRLVPLPYFVFLMTLAAKVALRMTMGRALAAVALGGCSLFAIPFLSRFLFLFTSPFVLILLFFLLRNLLSDMASTQRAREDFTRNLEASTLNPADASAHYNLGLIYQQRRDYERARASFARAVEISHDETDAHYQLGRIAREEGRLAEAIRHFDTVVQQDSEHSHYEIWREIGNTYLQAGQYEDARAALDRFLQRRPSDAEGRYRYGETLHRLGRGPEAADQMRACIEAVRTSPAYKYRADKRWMEQAEAFLRSQGSGVRGQ